MMHGLTNLNSLKCLLILGYRPISIGLRRTENASHVVQVAGSRAVQRLVTVTS
jgi:hypothetical protein